MSDQVPITPPLFETSLAVAMGTGDTTATLANGGLYKGTNSLNPAIPLIGLVCLSVDIGQPNPEYMIGIANGINITGIIRGIDPYTGNTTNANLISSHRRGASVKITDFASIQQMVRMLNGVQPIQNVLKYLQSQNFTDPLDLIDKEYIDNVLITNVLPPNISDPVIGNTGNLQVSSQNITVTTINSNRFLHASFSMQSAQTITAATYNSVPMTLISVQNIGSVRIETWKMTAPTLGTHTLAVTLSGPSLFAWEVLPCDTVDQTTPYTNGGPNSGHTTLSTGGVTPVVPNALVIHSVATSLIGTIFTPVAGENLIADNELGSVQGAISVKTLVTPAATTSSINLSSVTDWANVIGAINGIGSSSGATVKVTAIDILAQYLDDKIQVAGNLSKQTITSLGIQTLLLTAAGGSGGGGTKLAINSTTENVTGTTTETPLYTISIPGGLLGTNNAIRFKLIGNGNSSVSGDEVKVYYGGTLILTMQMLGVTSPFVIDGALIADALTNAQKSGGILLNNAGSISGAAYGTSAIDSTIAQDLLVTVTLATVGNSFTAESIIVETVNGSTGAAVRTYGLMPFGYAFNGTINQTLQTPTIGYTYAFQLPFSTTVNSISIRPNGISVAGTVKIGIYSEDGQTRFIAVTSPTISSGGALTIPVPSGVLLNPGIYYFVMVPDGTFQGTFTCYATISNTVNELLGPSGLEVYMGELTVSSGILPTTFDPVNDISLLSQVGIIARLDN